MAGRSGEVSAGDRVGQLAVSMVLTTLLAHWLMHESWLGAMVVALAVAVGVLCSFAVDAWRVRRRDGRDSASSSEPQSNNEQAHLY